MRDSDVSKAHHLATLTPDDLGRSEEEVKINFIVPLLELLGHSRLRFEHRNKDIFLRHGLPAGVSVVVETKRYGEPLDRHLDQLARYAAEERSSLALLTNGEELRLYAPLWPRAASFPQSLLRAFRRAELAEPPALAELEALLGADALAAGHAARTIADRQAALERLWGQAESIRFAARQRRDATAAKLRTVEDQLAALGDEKSRLLAELAAADTEESDTLRGLYGAAGVLPPEPPSPKPTVPPARKPSSRSTPPAPARPLPTPKKPTAIAPPATPDQPSDWTDYDLYNRLSDNQRALLAGFVRTGQRTLHSRDLQEVTGIASHKLMAAANTLKLRTRTGVRDTLLETTYPRWQ